MPVELFGIKPELFAIVAGVLGFFVGGILVFLSCLVVTKLYLWHIRRMKLKRKRAVEGDDIDDDEDEELTTNSRNHKKRQSSHAPR